MTGVATAATSHFKLLLIFITLVIGGFCKKNLSYSAGLRR
ncbi:hypothetical protein HMPREF9303_1083 [Prevotella denticola CRIS 18C-A]|uniref:Uncharacterized protein n=1 Tax=Prevotella denticola CRIS 18C-A TaxID=944557 RepID=F0H9W2_9BACT|nr:hypothetical protein HMPREF9303_1083 [Prevotella denticola CRIS 18C-A]